MWLWRAFPGKGGEQRSLARRIGFLSRVWWVCLLKPTPTVDFCWSLEKVMKVCETWNLFLTLGWLNFEFFKNAWTILQKRHLWRLRHGPCIPLPPTFRTRATQRRQPKKGNVAQLRQLKDPHESRSRQGPNRTSPNFQQATNFRTEGTETAGKRQNFVTLCERIRLSALFFLTFLVLGFSGHHDFRHVCCCPCIAQWENGPCGKTPNLKGRPKKASKESNQKFLEISVDGEKYFKVGPQTCFFAGRFCTGEVVFWVACFAGLVSQSSFVLRPDRA